MRIDFKLILGFLVVASPVAILGYLSWVTNQEVGLQAAQLSRSSIVGMIDASDMAIALHNSHAASHEYLDAKRLELEQAEPTSVIRKDVQRIANRIQGSLAAFERALLRSRQSNEGMMAWHKQQRAASRRASNPEEKEEMLRQLQDALSRHRLLVDRFVKLCNEDPRDATVFLENEVETQFNHEMLPLIRAYGKSANRDFTTSIRNVERSLDHANRRNTAFTILACLAAGAFGLVIARSIANPLAALKDAALQIGKGNFDVDIPVKSRDEIGVLASAFRQMAADLKATTVSSAYVDSILRSMSEMLVVVDPELQIQKVNPSLLHQLRLTEDQVIGQPLTNIWPQGLGHVVRGARLEPPVRTGVESEFVGSEDVIIPVRVTGAELRDDSAKVKGVVLMASNITERKQAEIQLRSSLREKEVLLKEVHHRVKNNLQVISSLLSLQANEVNEPSAIRVCQNSQRRIRAMALIHEQLYQSDDLARIDFRQYMDQLSRQLKSTLTVPDGRITIDADIDGVMLDIDEAIPCGMIVNELVTNAIEHAFPDEREGVIVITFQQQDGRHTLTVRDNGIGLPAHFDPEKSRSLGLRVVTLLARQLGGGLTYESQQGTVFTLAFGQRDSRNNTDEGGREASEGT